MYLIDHYTYNNRLHKIDPVYKAGLAFAVGLLCLSLNHVWVSLLTLGWMVILTTAIAGIPVSTFVRVLAAEAIFMTLTSLGIMVNLSFIEPEALKMWTWSLGPFWLSSTPDQVEQGINLITRALGCAATVNFLALTTPLVDLIALCRRGRVPTVLIDLMTLMYRFIFVLLDSLNRMHRAQDSRLGYTTTYFRALNNAALLGSRLFSDAFQRSRRLQIALESRGYEGDLRVLPTSYHSDNLILPLGGLMIVSLLIMWMLGHLFF